MKNIMSLLYKVVETSTVTDEDIQRIINDWVARGWQFDGIQFATRDASKRPGMAFVIFTKQTTGDNDSREDREE